MRQASGDCPGFRALRPIRVTEHERFDTKINAAEGNTNNT